MPTIIALDVSLSMTRAVPGASNQDSLTFHQLAVQAMNQFLNYLAKNSKLEYVSLVSELKERLAWIEHEQLTLLIVLAYEILSFNQSEGDAQRTEINLQFLVIRAFLPEVLIFTFDANFHSNFAELVDKSARNPE